ncbi:DoxX family membrane protein [Massilia sp. W12]|uniref:DoxX family protein n=1 Tax=Massilia sp. W12 TaxID=3126507 RepID=UPI0030D47583
MNILWRAQQAFDRLAHQWGSPVCGLFLRGFVSWQFFKSGMVKISDWDATLALFRDEYQVPVLPPELAAFAGTGGELLFPLLLGLGLLARPAALALFGVNLMAVISYPQLREFSCPAALNDHLYWGIILLALTCYGPGRISLDAWLARRQGLNSV